MTKVGNRVKCPKCRGEGRVVWVSQDGKIVAIRCMGYHSQISPRPTRFNLHVKTKPEKKGMVFLIEETKIE